MKESWVLTKEERASRLWILRKVVWAHISLVVTFTDSVELIEEAYKIALDLTKTRLLK